MLIQMQSEWIPMFKITVVALSLLCLVLAGYIAETGFNRFNHQRVPQLYQLSDETMAAVLENARKIADEMNTIDPLTGKTKMQTLTEESERRVKESREEERIAHENLLAARKRLNGQ
jgi:hypothetical protein